MSEKNMIITEADKNRQMKKEALISAVLYVAFFIWWYVTGYGVAATGTTATYTYVLGLPMWFFLSCVVGYVLFCIATVIVVKFFFKDFDLGEEAGEETAEGGVQQ